MFWMSRFIMNILADCIFLNRAFKIFNYFLFLTNQKLERKINFSNPVDAIPLETIKQYQLEFICQLSVTLRLILTLTKR